MYINCPRVGCDGEIEAAIDMDSQGDGVWAMAYYYVADLTRSCADEHELTAEEEEAITATIEAKMSDPDALAGEFSPPYDDY